MYDFKFSIGDKVKILKSKTPQERSSANSNLGPGYNDSMYALEGNIVSIQKGWKYNNENVYSLNEHQWTWHENWLEKIKLEKIKLKDLLN